MNKYDFILDQMKWSFSRLECYERCSQCFFLQYIMKKDSQNGFFSQYGGFGHKLLEKYFKNELFSFELAKEFKDKYTSKVTAYAPPNKSCDLSARYFEQGKQYFENFNGLEDYEILEVEKQYDFKIDNYDFTGIIDLEVKNNNGNLEIVDHKSKSKQEQKRIKKDNINNFVKLIDSRYIPFQMAIQQYLYCIPVYNTYGEYPEYLNFNMFRINDWYKFKFNKEDFESSKKWAIDTINNIYNENKWLKGNNVSDFWCSYTCGVNQSCTYSDRYIDLD